MEIGIMNDPTKDLLNEIELAVANKFDFLDITLEPPLFSLNDQTIKKIQHTLDKHNLKVLGHTTPLLPWHSPVENVRIGALEELERNLDLFSKLNVKYVTLHLNPRYPGYIKKKVIKRACINSLKKLAEFAGKKEISLMLENCASNRFEKATDMKMLLDEVDNIYFHLDISHAELISSTSAENYLKILHRKLIHVHLSDNLGKNDDHLPLNTGHIKLNKIIPLLKKYNYNKTVTLEIFSSDRRYLYLSRDLFMEMWEK